MNFSPEEARRAKAELAERLLALAEIIKPEGYTIEYRKSLSGKHFGKRKVISCPKPATRKAFYIFLHECAHAYLGHSGGGKPSHVKEMEAEKWAHEKMRECGIAVPRSMTKRAKRYVAGKIEKAKKHGCKQISKEAIRFAA